MVSCWLCIWLCWCSCVCGVFWLVICVRWWKGVRVCWCIIVILVSVVMGLFLILMVWFISLMIVLGRNRWVLFFVYCVG